MLSTRYFNARAGATLDEFPGVALEVDGRRTLAGRARSGGAVILPLQGNTVTLLLVGRRAAAAPSALVNGAALAIVATAVATALAKRAELIVVFADMWSLQNRFAIMPSQGTTMVRCLSDRYYSPIQSGMLIPCRGGLPHLNIIERTV